MSRFIILSLFLLLWATTNAQDLSYKPQIRTILETRFGKVLMKQCSRQTPDGIKKFWKPEEKDISELENNFRKILTLEATMCCYKGKVPGLDNYGYQYMGVIMDKKKYIYIHAFTTRWLSENWQTEPIKICDGKTASWGVLFNPDTKEFSQLAINGGR